MLTPLTSPSLRLWQSKPLTSVALALHAGKNYAEYQTAEWICEENHRIVRGRPPPGKEQRGRDAAVNGIDRGVAVVPPSRSHLSNHQARSRSTTSAGKTRFPSSLHLPPLPLPLYLSHMPQELCSVHVMLTCLPPYPQARSDEKGPTIQLINRIETLLISQLHAKIFYVIQIN